MRHELRKMPFCMLQTSSGEYFFASFLWRGREALVALIEARRRSAASNHSVETTIARAKSSRQNSGALPPLPASLSDEGDMEWPVSQDPLPQLNMQRGDNVWTEIMDLQLRGWSVADIISIFDDEEEFFREWLESIGSRHVLVLSVATANLEIYVLGFTHSWHPVSPPSPSVLFKVGGGIF
jgi:hypothetical protein